MQTKILIVKIEMKNFLEIKLLVLKTKKIMKKTICILND